MRWQRDVNIPTVQAPRFDQLVYSGSTASVGETIYYIPIYSVWGTRDDEQREAEHARHLMDKVPFIVPPLADKLPFFGHESLRALWSIAGRELRAATRVFCLGYSLPVTDITMRFFMQENLPATPAEFVVANTDCSMLERFRILLPDCEVDERFVGTANPIAELTDELAQDHPT